MLMVFNDFEGFLRGKYTEITQNEGDDDLMVLMILGWFLIIFDDFCFFKVGPSFRAVFPD